MTKIRLHIPEPLSGVELAPWFAPVPEGALFRSVDRPVFFQQEVERVSPEEAQAIVLANNFKDPQVFAHEYIRRFADIGERRGIPVFVFSLGDLNDAVVFDSRVRVLRFSVYRSTMRPQDIVIPTFTENPPSDYYTIRTKQDKPVVSFCGMGGFQTWQQWVKYYGKNILFDMRGWCNPLARARKIGVYWRRATMRACSKSALLRTHFIVRSSFSGLRRTIETDPATARREYLESIRDADFVLAPKGDGNYSNRFLKTLAFGRIPVLVDTDVVLPFENEIDYSKIIVRVPMREVRYTPRYICEFYGALSEDQWRERQEMARNIFDGYLRVDSFFKRLFGDPSKYL